MPSPTSRARLDHQVLRRPARLWPGKADVHADLGGADHQGRRRVAGGIAEKAEADVGEMLVGELPHGEEVGEDLGRVEFVGEAVIDRHAGMGGQLLGDRLTEASIFDAVIEAAEHARGVLHRFLVADLRAGRAEIGDVRALVVSGDLEAGARAGRGFFEDQRDVLSFEPLLLVAALFRRLEIGGEAQKKADFVGRDVEQGKKASAVKIERHGVLRSQTGSRESGQVMQWPPPRPRPSSLPGMVITSIPALRSAVLVSTLRS